MSANSNTRDQRSVALVDPLTGEISPFSDESPEPTDIIPYSALSGLLSEYRHQQFPDKPMPLHLAALEAAPWSEDTRLAAQEAYNSSESITMKAFVARYANLDVQVWGIMIFEHGPYTGKDGQEHQGYYQPRLLIEVPGGDLVVVRTGSQTLAEHIFYIIRKHGWWLFDEPITYKFTVGESGAMFMTHMYQGKDSLKKRLQARKGAIHA